MLKKMPIVLILLIGLILLLDPVMPLQLKQILYAISLTIKSIIIVLLPVVIFSLLFKTVLSLAGRATIVIGIILLSVCASNALGVFLSHYVGMWAYQLDLSLIVPKGSSSLVPAWSFEMPKLISNSITMFSAIVLGLICGVFKVQAAHRISKALMHLTTIILQVFAYLIPLFVAGFFVKLQFDGVVSTIFKDYTGIFLLVAAAQFTYILFWYFALNKFRVMETIASVRNMLPAAIAGFSTMSSVSVMPLTIAGVTRNTRNKDLVMSVVPATVNIHLIGDCFAIPIFAYAVMKSFGVAEPTLVAYLVFVFFYVLAKFSAAGVPGGGVLVLLPVLESHLGFTPEMLSLVTAIYVLFDPVITCANVLGNGAFAKLMDKIIPYQENKIPIENSATSSAI